MSKKAAAILMLILGPICVVDGAVKNDWKEFLVGLAVSIYGLTLLIGEIKKKKSQSKPGDSRV